MAVNYDDPRFAEVESQKSDAMAKVNSTYDSMINNTDKYYGALIDNAKEWGETQSRLQQERTDFTIEQIEQQKEQSHKDYIKEQSGAYVDWQKESNRYGANAEEMATGGLNNAGYGESSQVSMYNTYQNRVATARESYQRAVLNYDNAIKDAQLQNNSILAEIAYNSLQTQLELSLEGFQYKNTLVLGKLDKTFEVDDRYYGRYQDVLSQINTENALAEQIRQFNASLAEEQRQYNSSLALQQAEFDWKKSQAAAKAASTKKSSSGSGDGDSVKITKADNGSNSGGATLARTGGYDAPQKKPTTYSEAAEYLRKAGVADGDGGLLPEKEWKSRKYAAKRAGIVNEVTETDTYQEYLDYFVAWRLKNPVK